MTTTPDRAGLAPGIYRDEAVRTSVAAMRTGVPAFLGVTAEHRNGGPVAVSRVEDARALIGRRREGDGVWPGELLSAAVEGFFANGGRSCWVVPLDAKAPPERALAQGLNALERRDGVVDLVCVPDAAAPAAGAVPGEGSEDPALCVRLQRAVLDRCGPRTGWFAVLDALRGSDTDRVVAQRRSLASSDGALYHPWVRTASVGGAASPTGRLVPPCGHVAGVYARVDRDRGVHAAPANEMLEGVVDLEHAVSDGEQSQLNPIGVNCLRSFPARGIRVWGARTLSGQPAWRHVNVRRLVLAIGRRLERDLASVTFEPSTPEAWALVRARTAECMTEHFRAGALRGRTPRESFYVKCDAETNPPEARARGRVVTEIGLAPTGPVEFLVVRIVRDARGVLVEEPAPSG